jgi:hypothetical protein
MEAAGREYRRVLFGAFGKMFEPMVEKAALKYARARDKAQDDYARALNVDKLVINGSFVADNRKVPEVIQEQPGYAPRGEYIVSQSKKGGYRLYKRMFKHLLPEKDAWVDVSYKDVPDLRRYRVVYDPSQV